MNLEIREDGTIHIVTCKGRMDASVSAQVKEKVQGLIDKGSRQVVVDLEEIEFLDSSGLGALVACLRKIKEHKGEIKLAGLRPEVRSIFDITRVSRLFHICKDVSEALAAFAKTA